MRNKPTNDRQRRGSAPSDRPRYERRPERPRPERRDAEPRRPRPEPNSPEESNVLYGQNPVLEAVRSGGRRIERVLVVDGARENRVDQIYGECREHSIRVERVTREQISRLVPPGAAHQGVAAVISAADYADADDIVGNLGDDALLVLLDGVEDPRNLGAVIRSAECAGVDGVIIPERRAVGLTGTASKASAGAVEFVKVAKVANLNRLIDELKEKNIWVVGASGDATTDHDEWDWTRPSALVMGSEGSGLHRLVAEKCDVLVKIPMHGHIDSLNVSVAAGVILFEARRQRKKVD